MLVLFSVGKTCRSMPAFSDLNLCPELLFTLESLGYSTPTDVQAKAIPCIQQGRDVMAEAQTGTGKTAAFVLPLLDRLHRTPISTPAIRALILAPTRELAIQIAENSLEYGAHLGLRVVAIYGGARFDNQLRRLKYGADILVATPGRLLDMLAQKKLDLRHVETWVLDEADRMLDLGFAPDIEQVHRYLPDTLQTLLFSATFSPSIEQIATQLLKDPARIQVTTRNSANRHIRQRAYAVEQQDKADILHYLLTEGRFSQALIFTRTKRRADQVANALLSDQLSAAALHGDKPQREREAIMQAFNQGELRYLVATDVAARGLDIEALPCVINYDLPNQPDAYIHRIGRTGRAGQTGLAMSLVAGDERDFLQQIAKLLQKDLPLQPVPTFKNGQLIDGKTLRTQAPPAKPKKKKPTTKKAPKKTTTSPSTAHSKPAAKPGLRRSLFKK